MPYGHFDRPVINQHVNFDLASPWGPLSLKLGKGTKHCTREHCKARTKAGGRTNTPQEALRISRVHGGLRAFRFEKKKILVHCYLYPIVFAHRSFP